MFLGTNHTFLYVETARKSNHKPHTLLTINRTQNVILNKNNYLQIISIFFEKVKNAIS